MAFVPPMDRGNHYSACDKVKERLEAGAYIAQFAMCAVVGG